MSWGIDFFIAPAATKATVRTSLELPSSEPALLSHVASCDACIAYERPLNRPGRTLSRPGACILAWSTQRMTDKWACPRRRDCKCRSLHAPLACSLHTSCTAYAALVCMKGQECSIYHRDFHSAKGKRTRATTCMDDNLAQWWLDPCLKFGGDLEGVDIAMNYSRKDSSIRKSNFNSNASTGHFPAFQW